jgi:hypothetical protein
LMSLSCLQFESYTHLWTRSQAPSSHMLCVQNQAMSGLWHPSSHHRKCSQTILDCLCHCSISFVPLRRCICYNTICLCQGTCARYLFHSKIGVLLLHNCHRWPSHHSPISRRFDKRHKSSHLSPHFPQRKSSVLFVFESTLMCHF